MAEQKKPAAQPGVPTPAPKIVASDDTGSVVVPRFEEVPAESIEQEPAGEIALFQGPPAQEMSREVSPPEAGTPPTEEAPEGAPEKPPASEVEKLRQEMMAELRKVQSAKDKEIVDLQAKLGEGVREREETKRERAILQQQQQQYAAWQQQQQELEAQRQQQEVESWLNNPNIPQAEKAAYRAMEKAWTDRIASEQQQARELYMQYVRQGVPPNVLDEAFARGDGSASAVQYAAQRYLDWQYLQQRQLEANPVWQKIADRWNALSPAEKKMFKQQATSAQKQQVAQAVQASQGTVPSGPAEPPDVTPGATSNQPAPDTWAEFQRLKQRNPRDPRLVELRARLGRELGEQTDFR